MKILVAFEHGYRAYREIIAEAILSLRPRPEVRSARQEHLQEELASVTPHLVICGCFNAGYSKGRAARVELSTTTDQLVDICPGGQKPQSKAPLLRELLSIIHKMEECLRKDPSLNGC